jgi:uncharacterized Fe-S cluster protein YjdI/CDGSH-type Zn-finger protein
MRKTYRGEAIEVSFDLARCIHVGACLLGLSAVFDLRRRPWIVPDAADADAVAEVVRRCPSGALQYRRLDGGPDEAHEGTTVTPMRDGPLRVVGEIRIAAEVGEVEVLPRSTLCRCGQSASKPFCDNSHLRVGFTAPGEPFRVHVSAVRPSTRDPIRRSEDPRQES